MQILQTDRLILRHLGADDAAFILELLNEPSYIRYIGDRKIRTLDGAKVFLVNGPLASYAQNGFGLYLVELKATGEPVGICGLVRREALKDVDLGYAFLPKFWSKGYAVESARAATEFAREKLGLKRLLAITDPDNQRSIRVLEKIGMKFEKMVQLSANDVELKLFSLDL